MINCKKMEYITSHASEHCRVCKSTGIVLVYREDLEEFEEVECSCVRTF